MRCLLVYLEFVIDESGGSNSWRIMIGFVPSSFKLKSGTQYLTGSQVSSQSY